MGQEHVNQEKVELRKNTQVHFCQPIYKAKSRKEDTYSLAIHTSLAS